MRKKNDLEKSLEKLKNNKGLSKAWKTVYQYFHRILLFYCQKQAFRFPQFPADEIDDIVQDILLKFVQNYNQYSNKFKSTKDIESYLKRACKNRMIDFWRKYHREVSMDFSEIDRQGMKEKWNHMEKEFEKKETKEILLKMMPMLPDQCAKILKLSLIDDISLSEISKRLNIKKGTIYTQWQRCVKHIKVLIEKM